MKNKPPRPYLPAGVSSEYFERYGVSLEKVRRLRAQYWDQIHVTFFPVERVYIACQRGGSYNELSFPKATYHEALFEAVKNIDHPFTNLGSSMRVALKR